MTTTPPVYDDHHHHSTKCSYSSKQHCPAHRQSSRQQNKTAKHIKTLENIDPAPTGPDLCARCVPSFSCSSPTARGLRSSSRARVPVPCATSSALTECKSWSSGASRYRNRGWRSSMGSNGVTLPVSHSTNTVPSTWPMRLSIVSGETFVWDMEAQQQGHNTNVLLISQNVETLWSFEGGWAWAF